MHTNFNVMETIKNKSVSMGTTKVVNKVAKVSVYSVNVLATNKSLKSELASFGASRSVLLTLAKAINLPTKYAKLLRDSKDNKSLYEVLDRSTRRSKTGKVSPFFVLQMLHKATEGKNTEFNALFETPVKVAKVAKVASGAELVA